MSTSTKTPLYLIALSGQGDMHIKLVNKPMWDWIGSAKPGSTPPADVLQELVDYRTKDYGEPPAKGWKPYITCGSAENDAALFATPVEVDGEEATFSSMKSAMAFINKHNIEIVEEYEGYIY